MTREDLAVLGKTLLSGQRGTVCDLHQANAMMCGISDDRMVWSSGTQCS